jgi:hypothetical protein
MRRATGYGTTAGHAACQVVLWIAGGACGAPAPPAPPGSPEALAGYLRRVVGADAATRQREAASWRLDAALWDRTVVAVYRPLHAEYEQAFAAALPALVDRLARAGAVTARRHYAGDPRLTPAEARDRWALPTLFPSLVAEAGGEPIDAVFIADGADRGDPAGPGDGRSWRALVGLDAVVLARVAALDARCAENVALAGPAGHCTDVGAAIAEAALRVRGPLRNDEDRDRAGDKETDKAREDGDRLAHVCRLAETVCGKGSP